MTRLKKLLIAAALAAGLLLLSQVSVLTTFAQLPAPRVGGRILLTSDSWLLAQDTGVSLNYFGPVRAMTPPPALSTWTQVNFGASVANEAYGGIHIAPEYTASYGYRILDRPQPTPPYTITAHGTMLSRFGIGFRESATGKILQLNASKVPGEDGYYLQSFTSPTAGSVTVASEAVIPPDSQVSLRIANDSSTLKAFITADGSNWVQFGPTRNLNSDFTTAPDRVFCSTGTWGTNHYGGATLQSWKEE